MKLRILLIAGLMVPITGLSCQGKKTPSPVVSPIASKHKATVQAIPASWKTYVNRKYNFQLRYPSEGEVEDSFVGQPGAPNPDYVARVGIPEDEYITDDLTDPTIYVWSNPKNLPAGRQRLKKEGSFAYGAPKAFMLGNRSAVKVLITQFTVDPITRRKTLSGYGAEWYFTWGQSGYCVKYDERPAAPFDAEERKELPMMGRRVKTIEKIVSTFGPAK